MMSLYQTLTTALTPCVELYSRWRARKPSDKLEWSQRLGRSLPQLPRTPIWIHGASLGEARIIETICRQLEQSTDTPVVVSAMTTAGLTQLQEHSESAAQFLFPVDLPNAVRRVLRRVDPAQLWLVETELWPNFLACAAKRNVPVSIVNGRIAPEKMARYRRWGALYRKALSTLDQIAAQSDADAARFVELGAEADRVWVSGNMKFDLPLADDRSQPLRLATEGHPLWIAGSTRPGEERRLLASHRRLLQVEPNLQLLLAPRHLDRLDEVERLVKSEGFSPQRYSHRESAGSIAHRPAPTVWILDSLGELAGMYGAAAFSVVGGTLEPFGGHSPLEAASAGLPILVGPNTTHIEDSVELLTRTGAAQSVADDAELVAAATLWLHDPKRRLEAATAAQSCVRAHRGATQRTVDRLLRPRTGR